VVVSVDYSEPAFIFICWDRIRWNIYYSDKVVQSNLLFINYWIFGYFLFLFIIL